MYHLFQEINTVFNIARCFALAKKDIFQYYSFQRGQCCDRGEGDSAPVAAKNWDKEILPQKLFFPNSYFRSVAAHFERGARKKEVCTGVFFFRRSPHHNHLLGKQRRRKPPPAPILRGFVPRKSLWPSLQRHHGMRAAFSWEDAVATKQNFFPHLNAAQVR